jgi:hypothetical protein
MSCVPTYAVSATLRSPGGDHGRSGRAVRSGSGEGRENHEDFLAAIQDPSAVGGMLEDYRVGLVVDRFHDQGDRAHGRTLPCAAVSMVQM